MQPPHHDGVSGALRAHKRTTVHALCTHCLLCGSNPETARHRWECPVQSHEWRLVGPAHVAKHLCGAKGVVSAKPWGWQDCTIWGQNLTGALGVTEGLAGPHQSSRRPHPGPLGARRHNGVGVVRPPTAPAGGVAGRPQGSPELRPLYVGTAVPRHRCTTHSTQRAFRHTALPFCITRMQDIPSIWSQCLQHTTSTTPHHTTPHQTTPHHTTPIATPCHPAFAITETRFWSSGQLSLRILRISRKHSRRCERCMRCTRMR